MAKWFGADGPFYEHYNAIEDDDGKFTYVGVEESLSYLHKTIEEKGPFDIALGFSQGTNLLTMQDTNVLRKFLLKLFEALELISDSNTVHSDLKPDNVLVNYMRGEDNFHSLKVIDFGSAYDFDNVEKVNN